MLGVFVLISLKPLSWSLPLLNEKSLKPTVLGEALIRSGQKVSTADMFITDDTIVTLRQSPSCHKRDLRQLCYEVTVTTPQVPRLAPEVQSFVVFVKQEFESK